MDNRKKRNPRTKLIVPVVMLAVILLAIIAFPPFVSVPTGHTGVVTTFGRVEDRVLDEGFHFKNPVQRVVMMDNRTQKASMAMQAFSSDIQQVDIVCSVNYSVDRQNAQNLYRNVGVNYYETVMRPRVQECTKSVFTKYTAETLMDVRSSLSTQIRDLLAPEMKEYGILIASVTVENVDFTDAFTDAVEAKQVALQTKLKTETQQAELVSIAQSTAERDLIAARTDAEKRTILAEAEASVKRIEADADAYKVKVQSEAEAAANKLIASSLTDSLIRYTQANRWNGSLPQIVGNSTALPVLDLTGADAN